MTTTLLTGGFVLPCDGTRTVIEDGAVLIGDDGTILAVGPAAEVAARPELAAAWVEVVDATDHVVIPGLVNAHLHSGLLRGTAESLSLWDWLRTYVDPAHKALTADISEAASLLCYAESLLAGTTTVLDMWRFPERSAAVAGQLGLRATLAPYVADAEGYDYFETLATNRAAIDAVHGSFNGRVQVWVGLEHLLYCTEQCFADAVALADDARTGIHTHSSETMWEVQESVTRWGARPINVMERRGICRPGTVIAHCVWLDDQELAILAATGTAVAHCPCSNMKLASGPARVAAMRAAGITVGLGSDGEKENNDLDLFGEMKAASLLAKLSALDPTAGDPWDVLAMATLDGARALGTDAYTGSLEAGKQADVTVVSLQGLHTTPVMRGPLSNVAAHLVFSSKGSDVRHVWVDGAPVVRDARLVNADEADIKAMAQAAAEELFERRALLTGIERIQVAFDCADPHRLAAFWAAGFGYEVEDNTELIERLLGAGVASVEDVVELDGRKAWATAAACNHPGGILPRLLFQSVPEPKTVKNRVHLDIRVGEGQRAATVARLLELGATVLWEGQQGPSTWVTIADPEGNELCVSE